MEIIRFFLALVATVAGLSLAFPVAAAWLVFWVIAGFTRVGARLFEPAILASDQLVHFTPVIGWRPRPNLNAHYLTTVRDGTFHVLTDSEGWPDKQPISDANIVVFGDSYAFGYGVDAGATFWRCADRARMKAIGAPGYNMVQELLLMRELAGQLAGKLVIWFVYFGNDLYDNLLPNNRHYRTPFLRLNKDSRSWQITSDHVSPRKWPNRSVPDYYAKLAELCCTTFLAERAYSACDFLITEGKKTCEAAGAKLVLMTIPDVVQLTEHGQKQLAAIASDRDSFDANRPDNNFHEIACRLGVPIVPLTKHLTASHYKEKDPHWNRRGHQKVAELIENTWRRMQIDPNASAARLIPSQQELVPAVSTV